MYSGPVGKLVAQGLRDPHQQYRQRGSTRDFAVAISAFRISGSYLELEDEPETTAIKKKQKFCRRNTFGKVGLFGHLDKSGKKQLLANNLNVQQKGIC